VIDRISTYSHLIAAAKANDEHREIHGAKSTDTFGGVSVGNVGDRHWNVVKSTDR